jgi:glyoxylase-like metal-dependent hydrolase (beta-lactamase superfamily II)
MQGGGPDLSAAGVSNAGLIVGDEYLMAIDAMQGPLPARTFIAEAKRLTGKEFGRLINTHHHGDHVNGNQFFTHAEISSHPYCRQEVLKAVAATPKMWATTPGVATEVQLRYVGPAHTWGDVVVYLPQYRILFAGDVGFFWVAPYANNSHISKWIDLCTAIAGWEVDVIVPGHGPIGGKKELAEMAEYFKVLGVEARKRYDAKMTAGAAAAEIRLGRFDNWIGPERLIMDVVRWYQEWNGSLTPDYSAALVREATIEYNAIKAKARQFGELIPQSRIEAAARAS